MHPVDAAALADIRSEYGEEIRYTGAGLSGATITAIWTDDAAPMFMGPGETTRMVGFEIDQADLPQDPRRGNTILRVETGETLTVNDVTRRDDVDAWVVVVEQ